MQIVFSTTECVTWKFSDMIQPLLIYCQASMCYGAVNPYYCHSPVLEYVSKIAGGWSVCVLPFTLLVSSNMSCVLQAKKLPILDCTED